MEKLDHKIYKRSSKEEADACAWVFSTTTKFEKYYYKHPDLSTKEVRIRITSTGLCQSDIHTAKDMWGKTTHPLCPGHEIIGIIANRGSEAKIHKIGDKVMVGPFRTACFKCEYCKKGKTNLCVEMSGDERLLYGKKWGGYSTHIQLEEHHVMALPGNLEEKSIAPIMCAGITTFLPLFQHCQKGHKIAVIGCGGLGHFGVQWASKMGMEVDVFSSGHQKDAMIKELGAKRVFAWTKNEHLERKNYYDAVLNTLPCPLDCEQFNSFLEVLKPEGKILQVGLPDSNSKFVVKPGLLVFKGLRIIGSIVGGLKDFKDMLEFVEKHGIKCYSEIFAWEDFPKAVDKLINGKPIFRCVVDVDSFSKTFGK